MSGPETLSQFENRKRDHLRISLSDAVQTESGNGLDRVQLIHEALPELDFSEVSMSVSSLGHNWKTPFFISSMTAGHPDAVKLNERLARASANRQWAMAVGSQRRELTDPVAAQEWADIRARVPKVRLYGNLGLSQLIKTPLNVVEKLVENLEAEALFIHSNPLQEVLQPEGTPQFANGLHSIEQLVKNLSVPVIFKETGCGLSAATLASLESTGVAAVDVAGFGGTHWGRIEGLRSSEESPLRRVSNAFANWGISTLESLLLARSSKRNFEVWASGGVRNGLEAAKALALGANRVGLAQPILKAALVNEESLDQLMGCLEYELLVAQFCTGSKTPSDLCTKFTLK